MGLALIGTLECSESIPAFHHSRPNLSSEPHTPPQGDMLWIHDNSVQLTRGNHLCSHLSLVWWPFRWSQCKALKPKRSFNSLATASRNDRTASSSPDDTINSGYPSLFRDSTVSLIAARSSTPLHCTSMLLIMLLGLTFNTKNAAAPVASPLKASSCQSVKNPQCRLSTDIACCSSCRRSWASDRPAPPTHARHQSCYGW